MTLKHLGTPVSRIFAPDQFSRITAAITQVAANKLKIKIDAKCDLGSSHCYHVISPWQSVILRTLIVLHKLAACHYCSCQFSLNGCILSLLRPRIACRASLRLCRSLASMLRTRMASRETERDWNCVGRACHESGVTLVEHLTILSEHEK